MWCVQPLMTLATIIFNITSYTYMGSGCPTVLRCDHGTENCLLTTAQIAFRILHEDNLAAEKSVIYGASTSNTVCFRVIA